MDVIPPSALLARKKDLHFFCKYEATRCQCSIVIELVECSGASALARDGESVLEIREGATPTRCTTLKSKRNALEYP